MNSPVRNPDFVNQEDDRLVKRHSELQDLLTPNGKNWDLLMELLEIERELTLREES